VGGEVGAEEVVEGSVDIWGGVVSGGGLGGGGEKRAVVEVAGDDVGGLSGYDFGGHGGRNYN
jgi:hypothetical protein